MRGITNREMEKERNRGKPRMNTDGDAAEGTRHGKEKQGNVGDLQKEDEGKEEGRMAEENEKEY